MFCGQAKGLREDYDSRKQAQTARAQAHPWQFGRHTFICLWPNLAPLARSLYLDQRVDLSTWSEEDR
jgi:hypothetical protein